MRPRILIVEDEYLVAMMLEEMLGDLGYEVAHIARTLEEAVAAAAQPQVDIAILDLNLNGERSTPVAEALAARGTPFIFATGYGRAGLEGSFAEAPTLQKPFREEDLERALRAARERPAVGEGSPC